MIRLAETYRDQGNSPKTASSYEHALQLAREKLGATHKELACYVALMQLHGKDDPDPVEKYKRSARMLLESAGRLQTGILRAWLIDEGGRKAEVITEDGQYRLCLSIFPEGEIRSDAHEHSSSALQHVKFIYNYYFCKVKAMDH